VVIGLSSAAAQRVARDVTTINAACKLHDCTLLSALSFARAARGMARFRSQPCTAGPRPIM